MNITQQLIQYLYGMPMIMPSEFSLKTTASVLRNLHRLREENPLQYVNLYVSGEMQTYCDIEEEIIRGMFGRIVQGYLRQGYNKREAEIKAKEFFNNNT